MTYLTRPRTIPWYHAKLALGCTMLVATGLRAQASVPIREVSKPDAISAEHFGFILNVRPLANGYVFVNDGKARQLLILDTMLANRIVVIDSAASAVQSYGRTATPIIPYPADSTLFVDGATSTLLLYGPTGHFVRVLAPPKASDISNVASGPSGIDGNGNLIYVVVPKNRSVLGPSGSPTDMLSLSSDSSFVVRGSFDRRTVETIGVLSTPAGNRGRSMVVNGRLEYTMTYNPLTTRDEWAVFSDGAVGLVRGHDYHVDIVLADGTVVSGPKLPFDFKRVSDGEKRALIDSARAAHAKDDIAAASSSYIRPADTTTVRRPPGTLLVKPVSARAKAANVKWTEEYVPLDSMANYWPPLRVGAVKADLDAHLWILPTTSAQSRHGELVYDVVDNRGAMLYRVRMPVGRSIAGFGRYGVLYLMSRGANGWTLERSRVVQ